jgi:hypothetical protein
MREDLVGYLIGALEPHEAAAVEAQLSRDEKLRFDLERLRRSLSILEVNREQFEPPSGLAARTCQFVAMQVNTTLAPPASSGSRWRMADLVVAAGIFIAASMLFFPAIYHSRYSSQIANCENNLRRISQALADYSGLHNGYFPALSAEGPQSAAGVYAVKLMDDGLVDEPQWFICPSSPLADKLDQFHVPSRKELESVPREKLAELERLMGGSYGYNLGYLAEDGKYHPTKNLHRKNFAILADAPVGESDKPYSLNHGGWGHNVLFEDGHVDYLKTCNAAGCKDNIFLNDQGKMAAGIHRDDAVIGTSSAHPLITPVSARSGR